MRAVPPASCRRPPLRLARRALREDGRWRARGGPTV